MAWRETLCNILDATDKNLRVTSVGPSTHSSASLQKVTEQTFKTDALVARAEFSSLVNTVQSSLAELRLEVSAAQQISNRAASQLPRLSKSADNQHLQRDLYGASAVAVSPRISASMSGEVNAGNGIMRQHALMRHLQESVASHTSQIASVEGFLNVSTAEVAQLKANLAELAATAEQTQARTIMLAQQQSEVPARSDMVQLQDGMCSVEASLQHLQTDQTAVDGRWQVAEAAVARLETAGGLEQRLSQQMHQLDSAVTGRLEAVEGHLQFLAGVLGTKPAGTPDAQPCLTATYQTVPRQLATGTAVGQPVISIMQQLSNLHTEMSRLCQDQLQVRSDAQTSENVSSDLAELRHRLHGQETEAQQLQQAHSDALQQAAVLQQALTAQQILTEQMQQTQQSLTSTVDGMASDLARQVNDMQDAHSQLETQHASTSSQISEEMSQHHMDLCKLRAASAAHDEQLKQYGETLRQHEAQLARSAASQTEMRETMQRLNEHTGALSLHNTGSRGASETGSRDPGNRVEDRLTSLEADLAHSTAATDAMSSIIDQVAQLGEQQVQGCATRIAHLETDLVNWVDSLRQQQDTQAATMSDMTARIARLQAQVKDGDKSQIAARLAELDGAVLELQTASAGGSAKEADSELQAHVDALRGQVSQLRGSQAEQQSAVSSLGGIEHDVAVLRDELTQLQSSQAAQSPADPALSKLEQDLAALNAELSQMRKDHASQFSVTSSATDQKVESIRLELSQLQDQQAAQSSAHKLYSHLEQDVAALKGQLSQLDRTQGSQLAHEQWQVETQQLRGELAACLKTETDTGAAVAQHATHLSNLEKRLTELYAEMKCSAAQADPSSSTGAAGHSGLKSEFDELNERLFELRVELQNLTDDTTISVASIKRKAELAEQHAEEASEAAASCKQALEAAHATAPEAAMALSMPADPEHAQQHHQQLQEPLLEQHQLQEMLQTQQQRSLDLEKHCADMQRALDALPSGVGGLNAGAQHAQQAHVQELATQCTAVLHQIENLQVQLDSETRQHAGLQQQQQAQHQQLVSQHGALLRQLQSVQSSADTAAHLQQQQHQDLVMQQNNLQEHLKAVQTQAQTTAVQQQQQEQQQQQSLSQEASGLHAVADVHKQQLMSLQGQVASVQRASEAARISIATSSAGWQEVQQQVHGLQTQVDASKETQAEVQGETTELAAHLMKLAEKHGGACEEGQTGQAALHHRLRKIELTVAGMP
ncbi:TPA: hypothetical protein ACH3X1_002949 [Trebouxia sp. C0004]